MNPESGLRHGLRRTAAALLLVAAALVTLTGCGQKGPLIRPDEPPAAVPASPAGSQPTDESQKKAKQQQP